MRHLKTGPATSGVSKGRSKGSEKPKITNVVWKQGRRGAWWAHFVMQRGDKQIWRSLHTQYASEARDRASEMRWEFAQGRDPLKDRKTTAALPLRDLVDKFNASRAAELRPNTLADYALRFEKFLAWAAGRKVLDACQVTPEVLVNYRVARRKTVAAATAAGDLRALHALFSFARRMHWTDVRPFDDLPRAPRPAPAEKPIHPMSKIRELLEAAKGTEWLPALELAAFAGLRSGEILNLRWEDVDFERGLIHIVNRPPAFLVKTGEARSLPLAAELRSRWRTGNTGPLLKNKNRNSLSQAAQRFMSKVGVKGGIHGLRHNWITYLLLAGYPLAQVMAWSGHRNFATTQGYTHVRQAVAKADVEAFKKAFGG